MSLNGAVRRDPETPVNLKADRITIEGKRIAASQKIYLMLNKPRGTVTTASDERGRTTVYAYLPKGVPWVGPVGRLDKASEGMLLLTNDSAWSAKILAPETHLDKTYHVQVNAVVDDQTIKRLLVGVRAGNGDFLQAKAARVVRRGGKHSWVEIVLDEGKNRHIRRMLEELGIEVLRLIRLAIGPVILDDLAKGATRSLTAKEKNALDAAMQKGVED